MTQRTHIPPTSATARLVLALLILVVAQLGAFRASAQMAMPDVVCEGSTKHYWVDPTPGSTYTWQINGVTQPSTTHEIFITWDNLLGPAGSPYTLSVQERSASGCYGQVKSGQVFVNPPLPVSVTVSAGQNPACSGMPVTFTASTINGGAAPVYQWYVNDNPASGATVSTFIYQPANLDKVRCEVTSNAVCVTGNPASSNQVIMQVGPSPTVHLTSCFDTIISMETRPFKLRGGVPIGGTWAGPGVNTSTGLFYPTSAGPGNHAITYRYTNIYNCKDSASSLIQVLPAPSFTCGNPWTDVRDNKVYNTVLIGSQCWMAQNLDHGQRIQGSVSQGDNCVNEKYCFNNDPANCSSYGALYQWDELMRYDDTPASQGICPAGWHVPTEPEWQTLLNVFGGSAFAGRYLQDLTGTGFKALPHGVLYQNSSWSHDTLAVLFWTSTPAGPIRVISHGMNNKDASVSLYESLRNNAFPVRCLRD